MTIIRRFILVLTLAITPALVLGVDVQSREYEIELLIFENLIAADNGEVWPADYSGWFEESVDESIQPMAGAVERQWVTDRSLMRLSAERNTFGKSSRYRVLAHFGWRQTLLDRSQAQAFEIPFEKRTARSYVDGTVRVAVERYLHLNLDLQFHPVNQKIAAQAGEVEFESPEIRLTESRRMRSKEVHYFDNPRFGVIALINPYETPAPVDKTEAEIELTTQP